MIQYTETEANSALKFDSSVSAADPAVLLDWVNEITLPITGDDFFRTLTQRVAERLGVDSVLVTQCPRRDQGTAETLAFWQRGRLLPNIEFSLDGTPCKQVVKDGRFSFFPDDVARSFPAWSREQGQVRGYIGIPVLDPKKGDVVGHVAIYHHQPLNELSAVEPVFRILALRVGAEIHRRNAEQRERQLLARLSNSAQQHSLATMGSAFSHEIRQPLTAIVNSLNAAKRLLDKSADPDKVASAIEAAQESAARGAQVLKRLGEWFEPGSNELTRQPIGDVVSEAMTLVEPELQAARCMLEQRIEHPDTIVAVDRVLIQQVLLNLIRNGLQAIERADNENGVITVECRATDNFEIAVSDSGCGLTEARRQRLFKPFESGRKGGMGIGLALSRTIVESHGGQLWHQPEAERTTFVFSLPRA